MKDLCLRWLAIKQELESLPDVAARDAFNYLVELTPLLDMAVEMEQKKSAIKAPKFAAIVVAPVVEKTAPKKKKKKKRSDGRFIRQGVR